MTTYDGLDDLLAGRRSPAAYRWHAFTSPREARERVEAAGWAWGYVGGWAVTDPAAWHGEVARALALPAYYGRTLDALSDCLRDLPGPTVLVWDHWARLARADEDFFRRLLRVLRDRANHPPTTDAPPFAVLLWGEGPPTGCRSLD